MRLEDDVKKAIKDVLKKYAPQLWYYMPVQNGMGVTGIPDFVVCYRGQFIGVEAKKPGRRGEANEGLSGQQVRIRKYIIESGGRYFKIDDEETVEDLDYYLSQCEMAIEEAMNGHSH